MNAVEFSLWFMSIFLCSSALNQVLPRLSIGDSELFEFPQELEYEVYHSGGQFNLLVTKQYGQPLAQLHQSDLMMLMVPASNRQMAVYMDTEKKTVLTVRCDAVTGTCLLSGYLYHDGILWSIAPFEGEVDRYHAVLERHDVKNALEKVVQDGEIWRQHKENDTVIPGFKWPDHLRLRRSNAHDKATKTTVCNIIEVMAVADYTVWNFFRTKEGGNIINAEKSLNEHYNALFSEVDLRYKCLEPQRCIRVVLVHVLIQKTQVMSWSRFKTGTNVNGVAGIVECGKLISSPADLVLCFTRENIISASSPESIGLSYVGQICLTNAFRAIVLEDLHDGLCRTAAKLILVQLGILFDGSIGCSDTDGFIGSSLNTIPTDPAKSGNNWIFSSCSITELDSKILNLNLAGNNCLLKGSVTELELAEKTTEQKRAGEIIDLNHQCKLAVGISSQACLPPATPTIPETVGICTQGVFCSSGGVCNRRVRTYNGSPCGCGKSCFKGTCIEQFNIKLEGECRDNCNCMTVNGVCTSIPGGKMVCRCAAGNVDNGNGVCATLADCSVLPTTPNGMFTNIGTFDGVQAFSLVCNAGYRADNARTCIFCTKLGGFTASAAMCIRDCGKVPDATNGFYSLVSGTTLGATASLKCAEGYRTSAVIQITCENTPQGWSTPAEICAKRTCPSAQWVRDGDGQSCYLFGTQDMKYSEARALCDQFDDVGANINSNLVQVDSKGELLFLKDYLLNTATVPTNGYWSDLFQTGANGNEVWRTTGDPLLFPDWNPSSNEPNDSPQRQSCSTFFKMFQYRQTDLECKNDVNVVEMDGRENHALCEIRLIP